jgi:serine/threonine protein kinase
MVDSDSLLRQIPRYTIQERIGTGGMARVYRAADTSLERNVAVKVLHEHLADDPMFRARFEREAKFIASLNHPNIIQIFDYATMERDDSNLCYMVMTYLPGRTLKQVMDDYQERQELMPTHEVLNIIRGITDALDYAHNVGMVHRDIKPANILFDEREQAILTDFGIARLAESSKLTQENVAVGTPAYMAPEQAAGEPVDARTDIYALGVILYELLAGSPPFGDDGSISVLLKHLNDPVPPLSDFDHIDNPYLDAVVNKALAKSPQGRYQTAGEMADDLERAIANQMPLALSGKSTAIASDEAASRTVLLSAPGKTAPSSPTRQAPMGILVFGLAAIVVVLSVGFFMNRGDTQVLVAPTLEQPQVAGPTATLDPGDFRNFGGIDSMVEEESLGADSMTSSENMGFSASFDMDDEVAINYWPTNITTSDAREGEIVRELGDEGKYVLTNSVRGLAATSIVSEFFYTDDIVIMAEMVLESVSNENSGYGIVFHYMDASNYGVFAVDGERRFSIWFLEDGRWRELRGLEERWTFNDAVRPVGEMNNFRLEIQSGRLLGFVNDVQLLDIQDDSLTEGGVGIYLASPNRDGALASTYVDSYEVALLRDLEGTVESMTDEG